MSVRFQFAGDKDISVGRAGGASLFKLPGAISFPAAGTILETLTLQTYPIAEGGAAVTVNSNNYPSETASVYRKANGSGGNYLDWASAFDVAYIGNGTTFESSPNQAYQGEVPSSSGNYYQGGTYTILYKHDGAGSSYNEGGDYSYEPNGTEVSTSLRYGFVYFTTAIYGSDWQNGTYTADSYYWNGNGGYYTGTTPTLGSFHAYGTLITNDGNGNYYYWDGNNGYYTEYNP